MSITGLFMRAIGTGQDKGEPADRPGLYVHVPFCADTCDFCAFYQVPPTREGIGRYIDGISREAGLAGLGDSAAPRRRVSTIFWGGGTPGLLSPADLERLAGRMPALEAGPEREWSVELAPASVTDERLKVLRAAGVTRLSLGVQSFQPALLQALGRSHTVDQALRAYDRIRAAGFESVNLDLMFALPGQDKEGWERDLDTALALGPDHLSTYCLTFEEDTALWVKLSQGKVKLDPEHERRLYLTTWERLESAGYGQYEVSNFARPGHACRHNRNTWRMMDWIGLGPSAASQHEGWRGANEADLDGWLAGLERGERMPRDRTALTPALLAEDALIFGLRTNAGVDLGPWMAMCPDAAWDTIEGLIQRLEEGGLARKAGSVVALTREGRLLADAVGVEIMTAFEQPSPV